MMGKNIDDLISKYLAGEANGEEIGELESWAQQSSENAKILEAFRAIKHSTAREEKFLFTDRTFEKIKGKIQPEKYREVRLSHGARKFLLMKITAAVLLMVVASWITYHFLYTAAAPTTYIPESEIKSNPKGQRSFIYLPDGSTLWLNAESRIEYEKNFAGQSRLVRLVGEAYFMVKKDTTKPFVVHAGNTQVTALGTEFNVKAYEEDDNVDVSLGTGLVKVQKQNRVDQNGVLLHPGDMAIVPKSDNQILVSAFNPEITFAWRDGVIYFKDAQFDEVIQKLERWYGVKFQYDKRPSKEWHFTNKVHNNELLENVLEALRSAERIEYKFDGKDVILKF